MRRRVQPSSGSKSAGKVPSSNQPDEENVEAPPPSSPSSSSSHSMQVPLVSLQIGKPVAATPFRKRKNLDIRRTSLLLGVFILLLLLWCLLRYLFPRHRYHHLLEIPQIKTLLEEAPAPVNDHYVVFVSNANGKSPYNIAWAKSSQSAEEALKEALTKMPLQSARYPWFKIDVVTATKVLVNYDFSARHNEVPSWWYGIALDWDHEWVFLPDEVQAHGLVDWKNRLQWDRIGHFAAKRSLKAWPQTVLEDDKTVLSSMEVLHTNAVLCDFGKNEVVPLYHGHRTFEKLSYRLLMEAAQRAGDFLARNVHESGRMVYLYDAQLDMEPDEYGLVRHSGTIYGMAALHEHYPDPNLLSAIKRGLGYVASFVRDCKHPYDPQKSSKCVWDAKGKHHVTKLGLNALATLAFAEYTHATGDTQYLETAKSIANWIKSAQKEDGSFVQKVSEPDNKLDEEYFVRYYQGEVAFALARLHNVVKALGREPDPIWLAVAEQAALSIVERDSQVDDEDLLVDAWLLLGVAEMVSRNKKLLQHCARSIRVATSMQLHETTPDQDKDRLGIFGSSTSGTATATKTEGMCSLYKLFAEKDPELAATILETTLLSTRFQLQIQFRPETAMYMDDPLRILGGFHGALNSFELRNDYTQHHIGALLCMAKLVREHEVAWSQ